MIGECRLQNAEWRLSIGEWVRQAGRKLPILSFPPCIRPSVYSSPRHSIGSEAVLLI
jgi:hypothetical protein